VIICTYFSHHRIWYSDFSVLAAKLEADRKHNRRWQPNVDVLAASILFVLQSQVPEQLMYLQRQE